MPRLTRAETAQKMNNATAQIISAFNSLDEFLFFDIHPLNLGVMSVMTARDTKFSGMFGPTVDGSIAYYVEDKGLLNWAKEEGLSEDQTNNLPIFLQLDGIQSFIQYLIGSKKFTIINKDTARKV